MSHSKNLLALWKFTSSNNAETALSPLQLIHSSAIEERILSFDILENSKLLAAASISTQSNQPYVALFSLEPSSFFSTKAKIITPAEASQVEINEKGHSFLIYIILGCFSSINGRTSKEFYCLCSST